VALYVAVTSHYLNKKSEATASLDVRLREQLLPFLLEETATG